MPKIPKTLTDAAVEKYKAKPARYDVRDGALRGFFLRVYPSKAKTFYIEYPRNRRWVVCHANEMTLQEARKRAEEIKGEVDLYGKPLKEAAKESGGTLKGYLDGPYREYVSVHQSKGDEAVDRLLSSIPDSVLSKPLPELTLTDFEAWQTLRLKAGRQPTTINRETAQLRSALERAVSDPGTLLTENPLREIKRKRTDNTGVERYLGQDERERLHGVLEQREGFIRPLVYLALLTGLRRGELLKLKWRDITLPPDGRQLQVRGPNAKSKQTRTVKLNDKALTEILRWKGLQTDVSRFAFVFPGEKGEPIKDIKRQWRRLLKDAEITDFRFHDCRHDFASRLVMNGIPIIVVSKLLGHSTIKLTERYAHLAPDSGADAVDVL